jgi:5-methylcytosine-specific restriction endonuclease McrA
MSPLLVVCQCGEFVERKPCPACAKKQAAGKRTRDRTWRERQRRKRAVDAWIRLHGHVCPGYQRPAHEAHDLTADHVHPRSHGGEHGRLEILCRACNSAKGARQP